MRLSKKTQRLMPEGRELILQGDSVKINDRQIKVIIRKRFPTQVALDNWADKKRDGIKAMLIALEKIVDK